VSGFNLYDYRLLIMLWVIGFGLSACNVQDQVEVYDQKLAKDIVLTISPDETELATATYTKTPSPVPSMTPTFTSTVKPSATRTATIAPSPTVLTCWREGGDIERMTLISEQLRLPLDYLVYKPPCYEEEKMRHYPVLYLMHGQSFTAEQWNRIGADEAVDKLVLEGEIQPIMIVMPHDRYGGQPIESNFGKVVVEELIPKIDSEYRTIPNREHRAVGGMSRGAGWAIHFGIAYWDVFGAFGAHSPAVFHSDAQRMRTWLDEIPEHGFPRIYVDIGDKDRPEIMRSAVWFEDLLNEKNIPHEWHLFSGYHSEEYWQSHVEKYILWYSENW
jgi:enterochelin esterase-like enzyme